MKALERPQHTFFSKQAEAKPKQVDRYQEWLKKEDKNLIEYVRNIAETNADRLSSNLPVKHPKLKGFENRLYRETLEALK